MRHLSTENSIKRVEQPIPWDRNITCRTLCDETGLSLVSNNIIHTHLLFRKVPGLITQRCVDMQDRASTDRPGYLRKNVFRVCDGKSFPILFIVLTLRQVIFIHFFVQKECLDGQKFDTNDQFQEAVLKWLKHAGASYYAKLINTLVRCWTI